MKRELIKDVLKAAQVDSDVTVAGWVRTRRDSKGGFSFVELNDGSCFANIQIVIDATLDNYKADILRLFPGSSIVVRGKAVESQGKGQTVEIQAESVKVLGFCDPTEYPLGKQRVSFERLRELAHLRPRTNSFGAIARVRNALAYATHQFFQNQNFLYVHTPIITGSDCEGAGEMFQVTTLDSEALPRNEETGQVDYAQDFFGRPTSLTVSGQLEGETYACALGNIYTFGPTFRAENSNTRRHLAEFWMIEPEMAFADLADDADLAEDYLRFLFTYVLDHCEEDLAFFNKRVQKGLIDTLKGLADSPFKRISYTEAIDHLEKADVAFDYAVEWGIDLQSEHERYLTEQVFKCPVTVADYPREIKAFYMRLNDDDRTVAAMDVLLPHVGEIIGGSQREDRLDVLETRIRAMDFDPEDYWWYCDLRRYGSVPHAGFGLGFGRMVQFCTGMHNIRDVIPFPRVPNNAEF
ncbi:MAG: asparagine--tRNA ligase [Lentisphaerae bacterium]|jgi:asparaginyl-tRNA synthetase|nr:asparagine--tRNA ligase [Lentisphaerota bacterium]MBT4815516.1 asparagine--tRNA ligase [Lentisphaerota bacterium]MBT5606496.1 asparagine--tRNA ligase [Lentisphaerota bacterium]MBT7062294.1 asparagine--tRNA ligase [Lentisphaerota bacterium]MBT7846495.1 asparagine--tRNA ligase [Lentisphaerota bacterium]